MLYRLTLIGLYNYDPTTFNSLTFPAGIDHDTAVNSIILRAGEMGCIYTNPEFLRFAMRNWSAKNRATLARILRALTEDYNPLHNYDRYEESTDKGTDSYTRSGSNSYTDSGVTSYTDNGTNSYTDSGTDGFTETREIEGSQSGTTTGSDSKTAEETVSADNVSTYQPDRKTEESGTSTATTIGSNSSTDEVTHSGTNSLTHSGTDQLQHNGTEQLHRIGDDHSKHTGQSGNEHHAHLYGNIGVTTSAQMIAGEMDIRKEYRIYDIIADMFVSEFCEMTY